MRPSILQQTAQFSNPTEAAEVDVVLLDGGINIMSYHSDKSIFTPGQLDRMTEASNNQRRQYLVRRPLRSFLPLRAAFTRL